MWVQRGNSSILFKMLLPIIWNSYFHGIVDSEEKLVDDTFFILMLILYDTLVYE
jgi:hypothetical protein